MAASVNSSEYRCVVYRPEVLEPVAPSDLRAPPPIGNSADPDATAADRCAPLACERECEVAGGRPLVQGRFQTLSADEATEATMSNFGAPITAHSPHK